ncbi:N-acetyltransferase family protein [Butyrivibrio fibrisolvens]|uniref:GNAT family N-acetyltransferase n=1 Tax=Butyrivibrio fibrisolvens TaxID=831 RepID=UPI00041F095C|nr:N-acetyltransferase family protein [Butyrivibrio fibrisolvens]
MTKDNKAQINMYNREANRDYYMDKDIDNDIGNDMDNDIDNDMEMDKNMNNEKNLYDKKKIIYKDKDKDIIIREVSLMDAPELVEVYRPYVEKTAITFEYEVPSVEEFTDRIKNISAKYPYLVVEQDGRIIGYAYTSAFHVRKAYEWSAEMSIYLSDRCKGLGLGRKLYEILEDISYKQGITNLYACIGAPEKEDEYLTNNSINFHDHMGYKLIGRFTRCGYKFSRWYDMVWMEKIIAQHQTDAKDIIPYPMLN